MEEWFGGKVALVTGGAEGIGRASALLFAARGARVVLTDLNVVKGEETVHEICRTGTECIFVAADVSESSAVSAVLKAARDVFGRLDCALNNAGIAHARDGSWDEVAFDRTIAVNLKGVMNCMKAEIPVMLNTGGGSIVNTASINGFISSTFAPLPAYTASKHAVIGLTKAAALQYARQNIRVNAVCPGVTDTEPVRAAMSMSSGAQQLLQGFSPMGRMARPEEIAEAVIWLCSDKASFVTGHPLVVDGGFLAT
jgi:NAD(P)-dependent dehydrogenase (short-subunit alcohol dehydrogenase family)